MKKKLIAVLATIAVMSTALTSLPIDASVQISPKEGVLSDDYNRRRTFEVLYSGHNWPEAKGRVIGYCHSYIGSYKTKKKNSYGKYIHGMLIESEMEPANFTIRNLKYYGYSQYLQYKSKLPGHAEYRRSDPQNKSNGSDSYSVGINGGYKSGGISASTTINTKYCPIVNDSKRSKNYFCVKYDYKTTPITSGERKTMLFKSTTQKASIEWLTEYKDYDYVILQVYATFALTGSCGVCAVPASSPGRMKYGVSFC